jgi:hypothetical protein
MSRGPCAISGGDAHIMGTIELVPVSAAGVVSMSPLATRTGAIGAIRVIGVGSSSAMMAGSMDSLGTGATTALTCIVGTGSLSTLGARATGVQGTVGELVAMVRAWGATSSSGEVMVGVSGGRTSCGGIVGRNSLALGTGRIDSSSSVARDEMGWPRYVRLSFYWDWSEERY